MLLFLIIVFIIVIVVVIRLIFLAKNKYQDPNYLVHLQHINEFFLLIEGFDDYITWVYKNKIKEQFIVSAKFFKYKTSYYAKEERVSKFNDLYANLDDYVINHNKNYVRTQVQKLHDYFNNIEGKQLDEQQRIAVVTDEYSNLIIAGAGSGKTLTILAKIKYLIEVKKIKPEEILLLSFTEKTVSDLNDRINKLSLNVQAMTFHKLGYSIIKKYQDNIPTVTNENTLINTIKNYLTEEIFKDEEALQAFIQFVACYLNIPEEHDNFDSLGAKIDVEKGIDYRTLRSKTSLDALQGEKVKSVEELTIANFLFLNGIEYEYEKPYPIKGIVYRPDFYLKDYDIWLEHFGVDENNRAKWLTPHNEKKYIDDIEVKRRTHVENNTKLLETYSYYNRDHILLAKLKEMLEKEGVVFKPRNSEEIYKRITSNQDLNFGSELIKLIESFINLSKSRRYTKQSIMKDFSNNFRFKRLFLSERKDLFFKFTLPILERYNLILENKNQIDFNDMINHATDLIGHHETNYGYKYILIDEYQDISVARFNLIKKIREICGARLVCVGDDWQSIYRFAGSDINLFSHFEKHVGKSETLLIEQTYRNSQSIINVSARFIQKNKNQIPKNPISKKTDILDPLKILYYTDNSLEQDFINEIQLLQFKYGNAPILVLGRHSFDINDLLNNSKKIKYHAVSDKLTVEGFEAIEIKYLTVHRSKGLEAANVIILNLKNHLLGFPNKMTDDPILSLLLSDDEKFMFAEERRLFYVALTRTQNEIILFSPEDKSLFVDELLKDNHYLLTRSQGSLNTTSCPYCKTGKLKIRLNPNNGNQFLGCSHYPSCNQTFNSIEILANTILCPSCLSGFMVKRSSRFGDFLGCTNYPRCNEVINLK